MIVTGYYLLLKFTFPHEIILNPGKHADKNFKTSKIKKAADFSSTAYVQLVLVAAR
jgi:hypothetical protein